MSRAPLADPASAVAGARAWARPGAGLQGEGRQARDLSCEVAELLCYSLCENQGRNLDMKKKPLKNVFKLQACL